MFGEHQLTKSQNKTIDCISLSIRLAGDTTNTDMRLNLLVIFVYFVDISISLGLFCIFNTWTENRHACCVIRRVTVTQAVKNTV